MGNIGTTVFGRFNDDSKEQFGCEQCWSESAEAAWEAIQKTDRGHDLRDDLHCHIMPRVCPTCYNPSYKPTVFAHENTHPVPI